MGLSESWTQDLLIISLVSYPLDHGSMIENWTHFSSFYICCNGQLSKRLSMFCLSCVFLCWFFECDWIKSGPNLLVFLFLIEIEVIQEAKLSSSPFTTAIATR